MVYARQEMCIEYCQEIVDTLLIGDVTSGLEYPLAAEIDKSP
jgi:hypothetical protein